MSYITGWGRGAWSDGAWGEPLPVEVTGVAATGELGNVTVSGAATVQPSGLEATSGLGSVVVKADANVSVTGEEATSGLGSVTVTGTANVSPTGVESTAELGTVTVFAGAIVEVSGLEATSGLGSVVVKADAIVSPTGLEATSGLGSVVVTGTANVFPTGVEGTNELGTVVVAADANAPVTGLETVGATGSVTVTGTANVTLTGVGAEGQLPATGPEFTAFNGAALSTAQKKFGTASLLLDGTNDYVKSDSTTFIDGNFTVEFFVYSDDFLQDAYLWDTQVSNSGLAIALTSLGKLRVLKDNLIVLNVNANLTNDAWNHIALVGSGNFLTIYVNGSPRGQYLTTGGNSYPNQPYYIGCRHTEADFFSGYIDEFRASKTNRYSSTFTPTTSEFSVDADTNALLHFDGANGSTDIVNEAIQVKVGLGMTVPVTGVESTVSLGTVTVTAGATALPNGIEATGAVGNVFIWGEIPTDQTPDWQAISDGQTPTWSNISAGQTPNWQDITDTQSPSWGNIDPDQTPNWDDIAA